MLIRAHRLPEPAPPSDSTLSAYFVVWMLQWHRRTHGSDRQAIPTGQHRATALVERSQIEFYEVVCHEHERKLVMLYRRWETASRSRLAGAGFKPSGAAAFKRRGSERSGEKSSC